MKQRFIIWIIFAATTTLSYGITAQGYIVPHGSDTIYGDIKLNSFNTVTRDYNASGFDLDILHWSVTFRREGEKKYREYTPDMIDAFGFIHESKFYSFKSFTLQYNSITPRQREQHRFLLLVYAGRADLYQDVEYYKSPSDANSASPNKRNLYFLFNEAQGLVRVDLDEQHPTIRALLEQFSFEPEFVDQVPEDANVKDIRKILQDYDTWSLEHRLH